MDQDFLRFGLAASVTLLVVVDPPIFVALTKDEGPARRRKILTRAVLIDSSRCWGKAVCTSPRE
jgi:small neutral amino acid transporter SnatA (MarC family)